MDTRYLGIAELTEVPSVAVVVDVMRAFTVAAWAFARGAERIVLAESLDEARALKERHPDWVAIKDGPPAPGFDTVNSPGMLRSMDLSGRTVVQKTTAGTVGVPSSVTITRSAIARIEPASTRSDTRAAVCCASRQLSATASAAIASSAASSPNTSLRRSE